MAFFFSSGFYCCYNSGRQRVCSMEQHQFSSALKFRYCEKASKFDKNLHLVLKLLGHVNTRWVFFSNFCGFPRITELNHGRFNFCSASYEQANVMQSNIQGLFYSNFLALVVARAWFLCIIGSIISQLPTSRSLSFFYSKKNVLGHPTLCYDKVANLKYLLGWLQAKNKGLNLSGKSTGLTQLVAMTLCVNCDISLSRF